MRAPKRKALGLQGSKDVRLHSTVSGDTNENGHGETDRILDLEALQERAPGPTKSNTIQ